VNRPLVEKLLADSPDGVGLTLEDFVKAKVRRELAVNFPSFFSH
jgi:hypothetical protein